jgi:hypothetical protein
MTLRKLEGKELNDFLIKNWMTHDALWYTEAATKLGMAEASPMNLRVCRTLGKIEFKRYIKAVGAALPKNMKELQEVCEEGMKLFIPPFMDFSFAFNDDDTIVATITDCFAFNGMTKAGAIGEYECGIFERIEGWFDAMGVKYTRTPDLSRCLKYKGEECVITVKFEF